MVEEDPKRKGKIVGAVIAGMLVLAAAIVLLVMGLTGSLNTKSMKLENFVGQSYDTIVSSNQYDYVFVQESKERMRTRARCWSKNRQPVSGG